MIMNGGSLTLHRTQSHLLDCAPRVEEFREQALAGLLAPRKTLPCKFFYDERGSALFDQICELEAYYPTRTEVGIMHRNLRAMAGACGPDCTLIEYGSGSSTKTRLLLDALESPAAYIPIDISGEHLERASRQLAERYPSLEVLPVCADYTGRFALPRVPDAGRRVIYFPGSTIGNFEPYEARHFLAQARELAGSGGGLLIGVDLKKDPSILHRAYNDEQGVTAQFNFNLLHRLNRELGADFSIHQFAHYAFYNVTVGRIEMHLVSLRDQQAHLAGQSIDFSKGESIYTESSYKYTVDDFATLAQAAGFSARHVWTDERQLFSVQYLSASESSG